MGVQPGHSPQAVADDPLPEAVALAAGRGEAGVGLKLLGGLAVRVLTPGPAAAAARRPGHGLRLPVEGAQGHRRVP